MIEFYCPDIESELRLSPEESNHCVRVLRHNVGDSLTVVDGRGHRFSCTLADTDRKGAAVTIDSVESVGRSWPCELTVAVAPTKNMERIDWLVEKLVEIGVDRIVPLCCDQSERRVVKNDRLERIAVSAMKQSLKASLPEIEQMTPFSRFIESVRDSGADLFIAHCDNESERHALARSIRPGHATVIAIGPEGDFSKAEIEAAFAAGFIPVTLGDERLRTETAALYAATAFHVVNTAAGEGATT